MGPCNLHDGGAGRALCAYLLQYCTTPQQFNAEDWLLRTDAVDNSSSLPFLRLSAYCWSMVCCITASQLAATKDVQAAKNLMGAMLLQAEAAEKERKRKEKAEAHLFTIIKLSTRKDMEQQIGSTLFFDLVDQNKVCVAILICAA